MKFLVFISAILFFITFPVSTVAQNEVIRERSSLKGLNALGVAVNIEKSMAVKELPFTVSDVKEAIIKKLNDTEIRIIEDSKLRESDAYPLMHLHINIMYMPPGYYPYTVTLRVYQPVKLILNRDLQSMATTWSDQFIAYVSGDLLSLIPDESMGLIDSFKHQYRLANNSDGF